MRHIASVGAIHRDTLYSLETPAGTRALELQAALIAVRLADTIQAEHDFEMIIVASQKFISSKKSQVPDKIKEFINLAETQLGTVAKAIRSDNGREFINESLRNFYAQKSIILSRSSCNGCLPYEQIPDNDLEELNANRKMDRQKARYRTSPRLWCVAMVHVPE
ncbi:unnamed protein product [Trichogramma brassicae]|uniref:Integrase catalytic domain-containing protein n=1 Tax=Trichogramma brassicae TaxID=86971 RepID=A0A6H5J3Y9_9HYME|nr:unnamed protein product [Trichogramma brassicae]